MSSTSRTIVLVAVALYIACFQWAYVHYLYPNYDYLGFQFNPPSAGYSAFAWLLSLVPCAWMPIRLTRPSQFSYWVLYIAVYIPSMYVPLCAQMEPAREIAILMLVLFLAFLIVGCTYYLPLARVDRAGPTPTSFWRILGLTTILLTLWLLIVFRNHLHIVSFNDVYDLREAANDVSEGSSVNYAFMLLTGAINPFFMGYGLFYRRRWMFCFGSMGQLLIYSIAGTKGSILSVLFFPTVYFLLRIKKVPFGVSFSSGCLALAIASCMLCVAGGENPAAIVVIALFVVLGRTLAMGGLLTAQYYDFFQRNPLTLWSHIKVVNWFIHYPYRYPVGQELGIAYAGTTGLDATTHFFATDGIEAAGLPGILLIAFFCVFVFWALDSASQKHDPRLAALVTTYAAYNLANISIFTTLLSGGLALLIVLLYALSPVQEPMAHRTEVLPQCALC